ncbi:hypothetical protein C8R43DRAFT_516458 [Mycena crocata]|nr:hypothetical protein C8R43DRAFT_516458 [Mycena crocata]
MAHIHHVSASVACPQPSCGVPTRNVNFSALRVTAASTRRAMAPSRGIIANITLTKNPLRLTINRFLHVVVLSGLNVLAIRKPPVHRCCASLSRRAPVFIGRKQCSRFPSSPAMSTGESSGSDFSISPSNSKHYPAAASYSASPPPSSGLPSTPHTAHLYMHTVRPLVSRPFTRPCPPVGPHTNRYEQYSQAPRPSHAPSSSSVAWVSWRDDTDLTPPQFLSCGVNLRSFNCMPTATTCPRTYRYPPPQGGTPSCPSECCARSMDVRP